MSNPLVSVVIPSYNHGRFIGEAIASVSKQTYPTIELVVVDDGSTDGSVRIIEQALADSRCQRVIFRRHPNLGAAATIDRGISLASGEYVAILNSDDAFAPQRIQSLMQLTQPDRDSFLFTGIAFVGTDGHDVDREFWWYTKAMQLALACPTAGYALLAASLTVSTSNFFFNRALFDRLRGFNNNLLLAHDWDFVLRATHYVEPVLVPEELLIYRYHRTNSSHHLRDRHLQEGLVALERFLDLSAQHAANADAPNRANWPLFFDQFCARVSPWFSTAPLLQHVQALSGAPLRAAERLRGHTDCARDEAAARRLHAELATNTRLTMAEVPAVRRRVAQQWRRATVEQA